METMPIQLQECDSKHYKQESEGVKEIENVKSLTINQTSFIFENLPPGN